MPTILIHQWAPLDKRNWAGESWYSRQPQSDPRSYHSRRLNHRIWNTGWIHHRWQSLGTYAGGRIVDIVSWLVLHGGHCYLTVWTVLRRLSNSVKLCEIVQPNGARVPRARCRYRDLQCQEIRTKWWAKAMVKWLLTIPHSTAILQPSCPTLPHASRIRVYSHSGPSVYPRSSPGEVWIPCDIRILTAGLLPSDNGLLCICRCPQRAFMSSPDNIYHSYVLLCAVLDRI
jgi:hypothetical protein